MSRERQSQIAIDRLPVDILNLAVISVVVILLLRTAAPKERPRFLRHFAGAYALMGIYYLSSIVTTNYELILFYSLGGGIPESTWTEFRRMEEFIRWAFIAGSCFLLFTWNLLMRYPEEGLSKVLYMVLTSWWEP